MAKRKAKRKSGQFECEKCGEGFPNAKELGMHIGKGHQKRGRAAAAKPLRKARREAHVVKAACPKKCGLDEFKNNYAFAQHKRFCKGPKAAGGGHRLRAPFPPPPAEDQPRLPVEVVNAMLKNGDGNLVAMLKKEAAGLRSKADQIDVFVESFEAGAQKFFTK